jgi:four helix bundle protein
LNVQDFRKLRVWKKSHELVLAVYRASASFPDEEKFGITSQLRRAVASIPTNIAEGCGKASPNDMARFLQIARGSASEADYLLELARDLGYLEANEHKRLASALDDVKPMLATLLVRVRSGPNRAPETGRNKPEVSETVLTNDESRTES